MKRFFILLTLCVALFGCKKEVPNLDPYARLALNAATVSAKAIPSAPYSMDTVVRYAFGIACWDDTEPKDRPKRQAIPEHDVVNLKFWIGEAQSVIYVDKSGTPQLGWLTNSNLRDLVVVASWGVKDPTSWLDAEWFYDRKGEGQPDLPSFTYDTIGYVPNRVIKAAEAEIHKAFYAGDYEKCTQLFETAYVFEPITGPEWRALKAQNKH